MTIINRLRSLHLLYLSKPAADRPIYRAIRNRNTHKIVELGIGSGQRAMRMIGVAKQTVPESEIHYVGMDLFEGRPAASEPSLSLKVAHQLLRGTGVRVQLVPGNPADSLIRLANSLGKVDVLIVPAELDSPASARVWFFVPRMLHERSLVFVETVRADGQKTFIIKPRHAIDQLAAAGYSRRAA